MPSVIGLLASLAPILGAFTLTSAETMPTAITLLVWGVISFALIAPLQTRVVTQAEHAPNLASTLNQGAFNLGNAVGAGVGGLALNLGVTYSQLPWIGAALAIAACLLALLSLRIEHRDGKTGRLPSNT